MELQGRLKDIQDQGLGLAAISYDSPEILAAFSRQRGITFPLLSDQGSATIKAFGILNPAVEWALGPDKDDPAVAAEVRKYVSAVGANAGMSGMAFPGTFILDRQGRVTSRFFEDSYRERTTLANVMIRTGVGRAPVEGMRAATDHLELTAYPSDASVSRANHFSLVLDITPRPGMHVYAPGAEGYRVISLTLTPQSFVRPLSLTYPEAEIYHFEPLNERVPVFQKPFTLLQEVVLENEPKGENTLTVSGTLEYQACDDRICYNPVSVPLSWTVSLRPRVGGLATRPQ